MNIKKIFILILASAMLCTPLASCADGKKENSESSAESATENTNVVIENNSIDIIAETKAETTEAQTETTKPAPKFDNAVEAKSGDAYLAVNGNDWWIQYWGEKTDPLSYDAGIAHIDGNGEYTVSLTADTDGFRYAITKDVTDQFVPAGIDFAAVIIKDGETVCPYAVISIDSIKVNGKKTELVKKSYTNTEEGDIRSNIYNEWVSDTSIPKDAVCPDGALFYDGSPSAVNDGSYSAQIVNKDDMNDWMDIEVTFTVSGLDYWKES